MNYKIEYAPNPDYIQIHISKKIASKLSIIHNASDIWLKGHPEELKDLVRALFEVDGVISVTIDQYSIAVIKAKCFTWEDMKPALIKTIDIMVATNDTLEELPQIDMTSEQRKQEQIKADFFLISLMQHGININPRNPLSGL